MEGGTLFLKNNTFARIQNKEEFFFLIKGRGKRGSFCEYIIEKGGRERGCFANTVYVCFLL